MTERTYPREWFRISDWSDVPEPQTFRGETSTMLVKQTVHGARRVAKISQWSTWYPTLEEAQSAINARKAKEAEGARTMRISAAAPELFDAGDDLVDFIDAHVPLLRDNPLTDALRAALAKARG